MIIKQRSLLILRLTFGLISISLACGDEDEESENPVVEPPQRTDNGVQTIAINGTTRQYLLYVPDAYDGGSPVPLLLNFHGYTQTSREQMVDISDMRPLAEAENFILIYPQGATFQGETHWNIGSWTQGSTSNDLGFIELLIDEMANRYEIDLTRVYVCGYSNGGFFSHELACRLSHKIAAIGTVAANMSERTRDTCNPSHPTSVITISGTRDQIVRYDGTAPVATLSQSGVLNYWANFNNADTKPMITAIPDRDLSDGSTVELHQYPNGDNDVTIHHYRVINGGHDWPGSFGNMDIDANQLIWDFVSQYDINGSI